MLLYHFSSTFVTLIICITAIIILERLPKKIRFVLETKIGGTVPVIYEATTPTTKGTKEMKEAPDANEAVAVPTMQDILNILEEDSKED